MPTSCPSGMSSELPEPRKQHHGCGWYVCGTHCSGQGYSSPFWGRILWRMIHKHWNLCTQLPELQLKLPLTILFLGRTRFLSVNINTQLIYWIIVTCNQMMSFDFVIQWTHRLIAPRGVLCHPDQHIAMNSSPLQSMPFGKRAMKDICKKETIMKSQG